jgi:hypothetical protein
MKKFAPITSLEEDFKSIGLAFPVTEAKADDEEEKKEEPKKADAKDDAKDEKDEATESEEETIDEAVKARHVLKGGRYVKQGVKKHLTPAEKMKKKKENMKYKSRHKSALKSSKAQKRMAMLRQARKKMHNESTDFGTASDRIAGLLEDVQDLTTDIESETPVFESTEAIKGFAQLSLVADKLAERFSEMAEEVQSEELSDLSEAFAALADEAADSAEGLLSVTESADEMDEDLVESDFQSMTEALLEGLEVYADLIEGDDDEDTEEPENQAGGKGKDDDDDGDKNDSIAKKEDRDALKPDLKKGHSDKDADGDEDDTIAKDEAAECADGEMGMDKTDGEEEPAKKKGMPPEFESKKKK